MSSSSTPSASSTTATGLPAYGTFVKTSTWRKRRKVTGPSSPTPYAESGSSGAIRLVGRTSHPLYVGVRCMISGEGEGGSRRGGVAPELEHRGRRRRAGHLALRQQYRDGPRGRDHVRRRPGPADPAVATGHLPRLRRHDVDGPAEPPALPLEEEPARGALLGG